MIKAVRMEAERVITANVLRGFSVNLLSNDELDKKSTQQLKEMYLQLKNNNLSFLKQHEEIQEKDETRFFNHPECNADYSYWSRQAYWSIEEAIALLLGKNPRVVSYEALKNMFEISPFAKKYKELHSTAGRYVLIGELQELVPPSVFLAWAKRLKIDIPIELKEVTTDLGKQQGQSVDRKTMLTIILGMAMDKYNYNPSANRNAATGEKKGSIHAGLGKFGLDVSEESIRNCLDEAKRLLPDIN